MGGEALAQDWFKHLRRFWSVYLQRWGAEEKTPRTPDEQERLEKEVSHLLREEAALRIKPGLLVEQLDFPEFKAERPELRDALLKRLKELGRVPQDKE